MKSLAEQDAIAAADQAFQEALGEEGQKAMGKVFADTVNSVENQLFAFSCVDTFLRFGATMGG
jgi:hypothetical protein